MTKIENLVKNYRQGVYDSFTLRHIADLISDKSHITISRLLDVGFEWLGNDILTFRKIMYYEGQIHYNGVKMPEVRTVGQVWNLILATVL